MYIGWARAKYEVTLHPKDVDAMGNLMPNIHLSQLNEVNARNKPQETLRDPNY